VTIARWLPQTQSSVDIEWEDPEMPNGVITQFIIRVLNYTSGDLLLPMTVDASMVYRVSFGVDARIGESSVSELQLPDLTICYC